MKTPVAVTLVIMGALLIMAPAQSDSMNRRNLVELMSKSHITSATLVAQMCDEYRFGCWLTGTGMIAIVVFS